jgi:hypothetical protein
MVKEGKCDLLADSHSILNRWKNYFCQLLSVHGVNDDRQTEIHTAETLVPEPSSSEVVIVIEELKRYKAPGIDQISANLIQAGGIHYVLRSTKLLIVFGIRKNCQSSGRNLLLYLFIRRVTKRTVVNIEEYRRYQLHTKPYPAFFYLG